MIRAVLPCVLLFLATAASHAAEGVAVVPPSISQPHQRDPAPVPAGLTCPGDHIVWVNTHTNIYRREGAKWFGRTKVGKYLCEQAAKAEGDRETLTGD